MWEGLHSYYNIVTIIFNIPYVPGIMLTTAYTLSHLLLKKQIDGDIAISILEIKRHKAASDAAFQNLKDCNILYKKKSHKMGKRCQISQHQKGTQRKI